MRVDRGGFVRKLLAGVLLGCAAAATVLLLHLAGWLDTAELKTYDWRIRSLFQLRQATNQPLVHPDIVLVEINDAALRDLAEVAGRWPWPRALHALLIDFLDRGAPRVVALDIGFYEPEREATYPFLGREWTSAESDRQLAAAVGRAGNVILLADAVDPGLVGGEVAQKPWDAPPYRLGAAIEERPVVTLPYDSLAASAAGFGHNFLAVDPDGPARRMAPFVRKGDGFMPSLGVAAALAAGGYAPEEVVLEGAGIRIRDRTLPLVRVEVADAVDPSRRHDQLTMLINYRAPAHIKGVRPYPTYEATDLLRSEGQIQIGEQPDLDPALFENKIVFVGLTASGLLEFFPTPFGRGVLPGIQVHASVADSVLSGRFIRPSASWSVVAAAVGSAILIGLASASLPFAAAVGSAAVLVAAWTAIALIAFDRGLWLPMAQPLLAVAVALFAGTAYRYFVEDAEKRRVSRLFGRYVSPDIYEQLMANPRLAELGGRRRDMTVLFSDIRGFTAVTEQGDPEALVAQLNEYFTHMVEIVFRHGGTLDKFVGDAVMALFGAPVDDADHAERAVAAAVEMVGGLGELNRKWAAGGRPQLDIRIGVNSGEMIAGNIGSSSIMSYTVIGDNVNLAARLESLNKEYRTRIMISGATRDRLRGSYEIRPLGGVVVKGKTRPVEIFEVLVPPPLRPPGDAAVLPAVEEKVI